MAAFNDAHPRSVNRPAAGGDMRQQATAAPKPAHALRSGVHKREAEQEAGDVETPASRRARHDHPPPAQQHPAQQQLAGLAAPAVQQQEEAAAQAAQQPPVQAAPVQHQGPQPGLGAPHAQAGGAAEVGVPVIDSCQMTELACRTCP